MSPSLGSTCMIDLALPGGLSDLVERTEAGTAPSVTDDLTVVMPFPPLCNLAGPAAPLHLFPPSPPVPYALQKPPSKLRRVPAGAWLFVLGFLYPPSRWIGAFWPSVDGGKGAGEEEKDCKKGNEGKGLQVRLETSYTYGMRFGAASQSSKSE
ncbi:hypothetical protein JCM11641_004643 [Rhodosporidiobolus odoratus]